jgi:hypothetical protein
VLLILLITQSAKFKSAKKAAKAKRKGKRK